MKTGIYGLSFQNFRSVSDHPVEVAPCSKVNLLIGQNNSGKSNILRAIRLVLTQQGVLSGNLNREEKLKHGIESLDFNSFSQDKYIKFCLYIDRQKDPCKTNFTKKVETLKQKGGQISEAARILESSPLLSSSDSRAVGYKFRISRQAVSSFDQEFVDELANPQESGMNENQWAVLSQGLSGSRGDVKQNILSVLRSLTPYRDIYLPETHYITAVREVSNSRDTDQRDAISGQGLINELARRQEPSAFQTHLMEDFKRINEFVKDVLDDRSAEIRIPYERDTIILSTNRTRLPLHYIGTGVHEVIIIAAESIVNEGKVFLVEEPEIHMHPLLQRRLLRFLFENTRNQYFIATHSPHLMGVVESSVFRVDLEGGSSSVRLVDTQGERAKISVDLGYRPSDLVQANSVIWVEGPTDRMYINWWLFHINSDLIEGHHYSIMFYGGRLLSHLTGDEGVLEDFIELKKLNRFSAIVIDSDKRYPQARINSTKRRLRDEFKNANGVAWITKGREIENYVDAEDMRDALEQLYPECIANTSYDAYGESYQMFDDKGNVRKVDKIRLAKQITQNRPKLKILDLEHKIKELDEFIRRANKY